MKYTALTASTNAGTTTYSLDVPAVFAQPGLFGARLRAVWPHWGQDVARGVVAGAVAAFPFPAMQAAFAPTVGVDPFHAGMTVPANVMIAEWGNSAHWPLITDRLRAWAAAHGIPAYWVARKQAEADHPGKHAMPGVLAAQIPAFLRAMQGAVGEAFTDG